MIMEIYHLTMRSRITPSQNSHWTITDTANYFKVSTGLVSENLKLARAFHSNNFIGDCKNRQEALEYMGKL